MNDRDHDIIETLRISERDKTKLLWAIEKTSRRQVESSQRRLRVTSANNQAVLTLIGDNGSRTRFAVLTRDLSRWGASLLHGRYMYPDTRCELEIRGLDNSVHVRSGEIRHIRHAQGLVHNLGVRFDEPIDLTDFVTLSPDEEARHLQELADDMAERGEVDVVPQAVSRVLVVDDYTSDRKLFSYWLTRAGMEVATANDAKTARERAEQEDYDLLVVDGLLGGEQGADLIGKLRNAQFVGPILAVSADEGGESERKALAAGANAFLAKPFTYDRLADTAFELLGIERYRDKSPIYSAFNDDKEMRPLLTAFTCKLSDHVKALHTANSKNDYETIDQLSRTLKGAGSGYGLTPITEHALAVMNALDDSAGDMAVIRQTVNELISVLNRVKLG